MTTKHKTLALLCAVAVGFVATWIGALVLGGLFLAFLHSVDPHRFDNGTPN